MSLDKSILHGKEHRKEYRGSKSIDRSCRNHGSCPWCEANRTFNAKKRLENAQEMEKEEITEYENERKGIRK